jgi:excisionase family DNA binding protein
MPTKVKQKSEPGHVEPEPMLTYEQVADLAGVSVRQVRRWVEEGRMGYVELPRGRRVLARHYMAFVERHAVEPAS